MYFPSITVPGEAVAGHVNLGFEAFAVTPPHEYVKSFVPAEAPSIRKRTEVVDNGFDAGAVPVKEIWKVAVPILATVEQTLAVILTSV